MLIRKKNRHVPELNTTSTADISFMLLIFFLVTTSMDVDKGLVRQLPPFDDKAQQGETDIERGRMMSFKITPENKILLDGRPADIKSLRSKVANFISRKGQQHVIYVDADPASDYNVYFDLQNEIIGAYNAVRNAISQKKYGKPFAACSESQKQAIVDACPQHIAETYSQNSEEGGQNDN